MCRLRFAALLFFALCLGAARLQAQTNIPSFPGAVGFGGTTTGACTITVDGTTHTGGNVYIVTNLTDAYPNAPAGSFRAAVGTSGNFVVFEVGGNIQLVEPVTVASNVTIEGQTAPGGIQVYGAETGFDNNSNILCRFMHFRDGTLDPNYPGPSGTDSSTNAVNLLDTTNIMLDHCSFEFAAYNNIDAGSNGSVNVTFSNCLFADPISYQQFNVHLQGGPATFIDDLWANAHNRSPLGKVNMQYVNNIVYNYQAAMTTGDSSGAFLWDVINNYFIAGPSTTSAGDAYYQVDSTQEAYAIGNYIDSNKDGALNGSSNNSTGATVLGTYWSPATASLPTLTAANAFYPVVSNAGPLPHDPVDSQVVTQVLSLGTQGSILGTQTDTGLSNDGYGTIVGQAALPDSDASGMPDDWKTAMGLSLTNPAVGGVTSTTGYTNLENYANWKALPNAWVAKNTAAQPTSVVIDLSQYANGFGTSATYSVSNVIKGTATQTGSAPYLVTYVPTSGTSGLGGFNWSVNNGITSMSSTCGVLISVSGPSQSVVWKGNGSTNAWDTSTANWTLISSGSAVDFISGDLVTFNDTGSASPAVNIDTSILPGSITVNTSTNNYILSGTGSIVGSGTLVKSGTSSLTIENTGTNTFSGGTIIDAGAVYMDNVNALGAGTFTLNGGDLEMNANISPSNAIAVNVASTLGLDAAGSDVFLGGAVSGAGALALNFNSTGIICSPQGSWSSYTGTLTVSGAGSLRIDNDTAWGFPDAVVNIDGATTVYNRATNSSVTISLGALNGVASSFLQGSDQSSSAGFTGTYSIGALNLPSVFNGIIQNSTNQTVAITTVGSSTLTLTGTSTYTGATTVSGGTLLLLGALGNTAVAVSSGASFITTSTVAGSVTVNAGGSLYIGNSATPGVIGTVTGGDGFSAAGGTTGASLYYDLSDSPTATGSNDLITATAGTLSLSGIVDFDINMTNGQLGAGTYNLINGGATLGVSGLTMVLNLGVPVSGSTRQTFGLIRPASGTDPGYIHLSVAGSAGALTWTGSNATGGVWDMDTTATSWTGATPSTFFDLDTVTFNDSTTAGTVTLSGTLAPGAIYVSNTNTNYTFTGSGYLTGNGQLVKSGPGTLTIDNSTANSLAGPIYIDAGTLTAEQTLGTGTIFLNGGTLSVNGNDFNGTLGEPIVVNASSTIDGAGNVYLSTLTSTSSAVTLYIGTSNVLSFSSPMTGFSGTIEMGSSTGTLRINGSSTNSNFGTSTALFDVGTATGTLNNRNGAITVNFGAVAGGPGTFLSGRQSGSGATTSTYIIGALNTNNTFAGTISNGGDEDGLDITKVGTGNWTLSGTSNYLGTMLVQVGTLTISGSYNNGGDDFEAQIGSALTLAGGTIATSTVQIDSGAVFTGNGTINGDIVNHGSATINGGAPLTVNGNFENDGTMIVDGSSSIAVNLPSGGSGFVNNGLLDIMDSPQTVLPSGYVNDGTILTSSLVTVKTLSKSGNTFTVSIQSYTGHTYQLQKSSDLNTWQNVGTSQAGSTGSAIVLSDTNATSSGMFYQVGVGP
jgi:autotransporter-associated beta strand protein